MAVAADIVFIWPSTNASIPSGWARDTSFDSKYVRGADAGGNGGGTGGSTTHNHTVVDHTHIQNSHLHVFSLANSTNSANAALGTVNLAAATHAHGNADSNSTVAVNQNASITLNTASNDPPYYEVIFIKSNGTNDLADGMVGWYAGATVPTGWYLADGNNSTVNLLNRFLKGATAGGNGGGTGGSSDVHTHTETATHTHTQNSHTHSNTASAPPSATSAAASTAGNSHPNRVHTHTVSFSTDTATNQNASITLQNGDAQPEFYTLKPIQNKSGVDSLPEGIIGLWKSTNATIPSEWERFTAMDTLFAKGSSSVGSTGGSKTHTHIADAHTHTQDAHGHTGTSAASALTRNTVNDPTIAYYSGSHTHNVTVTNTTATNQNTTVTVNSCSSEAAYPEYIKAIFIKLKAAFTGQVIRIITT